MNISQIGLGLTFIASLGWAIQTLIESHKDVSGRVVQLYKKQQKQNKSKLKRNVFWLALLCIGFLLQLIGSF